MIKMEVLREMYLGLGFEKVQSYIQSGNVVFCSQEENVSRIEFLIHSKIKETLSLDVPVLVLEKSEFNHTLIRNPFVTLSEIDPKFLHVTFLSSLPKEENIQKLGTFLGPERFILSERAIYLYLPLGSAKTKLTNTFFESKLKLKATTRNWKSCCELSRMAEAL